MIYFYFNEIKALSSLIQVLYSHACQLANGMANIFPKQGVDRLVSLVPFMRYFILVF